MQFSYRVLLHENENQSNRRPLAVGDVIRCPAFRLGNRPNAVADPRSKVLPQLGSEGEVHVAWRDESRMRHYVDWVNSTNWGRDSLSFAIDDSRGTAPFLVTGILLDETWGPEDVGAPARLYRVISCSRLAEDGGSFYLNPNAERIHFLLDDPLASCSPDPNVIEVLGFAAMPIGWELSPPVAAASPIEKKSKKKSKSPEK